MRKIIYQCDECKKVLSDSDKIVIPHLSICFGNNSGWVRKVAVCVDSREGDCPSVGTCEDIRFVETNNAKIKAGQGNGWHFETGKISGIKQFCNGKCLGKYFDKHN